LPYELVLLIIRLLLNQSDEFDWFYFLDRLIISHFCSKWRTVLLDNVEFWRHLHIHAGFPLTYLEKKRRVPFRKNVVPVPAHAPQNSEFACIQGPSSKEIFKGNSEYPGKHFDWQVLYNSLDNQHQTWHAIS
jgi:hypothetical protein